MQPHRIINSQTFFKGKCIIYGWFRDGKYLYIGTSTRGEVRLWHHACINRVEKVQPNDEFHFWDFDNDHELYTEENRLNCVHKPKYNTYVRNRAFYAS